MKPAMLVKKFILLHNCEKYNKSMIHCVRANKLTYAPN